MSVFHLEYSFITIFWLPSTDGSREEKGINMKQVMERRKKNEEQ